MRILAAAALGLMALLVPAAAAPANDVIGQCVYCHGDAGIAKDKDVPHLAGQQRTYLYNQLLAFRGGKRKHKEMRYMSRHMSDAEMRAIADYYSSLPPR